MFSICNFQSGILAMYMLSQNDVGFLNIFFFQPGGFVPGLLEFTGLIKPGRVWTGFLWVKGITSLNVNPDRPGVQVIDFLVKPAGPGRVGFDNYTFLYYCGYKEWRLWIVEIENLPNPLRHSSLYIEVC